MSAPTPVFTARFEGGRLKFDRREAFLGFLGGLEGQPLDVRVSKRRKDHSNQQQRFYRGVVVRTAAEFTGYTDEEIHEAFRQRFLLDHSDPVLPRVKSTSSLTKEEFARYIDDCIRLCAEMGCIVPDASNY